MTLLEKYLYQLRRIEEHRTAKAEKEIRKEYKGLLQELNKYLADTYIHYSENDALSYTSLAAAGMDARFLEEVEQRINGISPNVSKIINNTVNLTYEACYNGMVDAVNKAAGNRELLKQAFSSVSAATPDVIKRAVENPVSGLTLKDTLEKHRKEIIYDIKRNIGVGLTNGDRFSTMANRISESLDGDYKKSIRIVRTETHRVRESGFNDAATEINTALQNGKSGYVMAKTWHTMEDERVRPKKAKGKARKYNHVKMNGVTIPQNELFVLPSGAKGKAPSQTGVAGEDINCRCYLSYDLVLASELTKVQNGTKTIEEAAEATDKKEKGFVPAKDIQEAKRYAEADLGVSGAIAYTEKNFNLEVANAMNKAIFDIGKDFAGIEPNYIVMLPSKIKAYAAYASNSKTVGLNKATKTKGAIAKMVKEAKEQHEIGFWSGNKATHSIYHELGHAVQHTICDNDPRIANRIDILYKRTFEQVLGKGERWSMNNTTRGGQACKAAGFSYYGMRNSGEFIAESIAQYYTMESPSEIAKKVIDTLKGGWE